MILVAQAALVALAGLSPAQGGPQDSVLRRNPAALPRAEPERWKGWSGAAAPPEELRGPLREIGRAYRESDYPAALAIAWRMLETEPDYPPALYQLGVVYFRLRRYGDCIALLERFLAVAPGEIGSTQALGHAYYTLGDYPRALAHYEKVVEAAPEAVEALRGLALSNMRVGALERALALIDRVLELRPEHADALTWRAQILFDLERTEDSLAAADCARSLAPFEPQGHFLAAQALRELGRHEEAQAAERRFSELNSVAQKVRTLEARLLTDPRQAETLLRLIALHRSVGNLEGLREVVARLIQARPGDLATAVFALDTLQGAGDQEGARQAALGLERNFADQAEAWRRLRDYYGAVGDRVRQIQAGERYLRLGGERGG